MQPSKVVMNVKLLIKWGVCLAPQQPCYDQLCLHQFCSCTRELHFVLKELHSVLTSNCP